MKFSVNRVKQGLGELQTTLHWAVSIPNPAAVAGEFPEDLEVRVQTTGMPNPDVQSTQIDLGGHTINYNGKVKKAGELTWKAIEGTDSRFTQYMLNWINARWSSDGQDTKGAAQPTADCKADVVIQLLGPDDEVTQTFTLVGVLPKFEMADELGQTADPMSPTITFEYDDYHHQAGDVNW